MKHLAGQTGAWLSSIQANTELEFEDLVITAADMSANGWIRVGTATVSVELFSQTEQVNAKLAMLNEADRRAEAEYKHIKTQIEGERQKLMALEYRP